MIAARTSPRPTFGPRPKKGPGILTGPPQGSKPGPNLRRPWREVALVSTKHSHRPFGSLPYTLRLARRG